MKGPIRYNNRSKDRFLLQKRMKGPILAITTDPGTDTLCNNRSRDRYVLNKTTLIMGQILATQQIKGQAHGRTSLFNTNLEISVSLII